MRTHNNVEWFLDRQGSHNTKNKDKKRKERKTLYCTGRVHHTSDWWMTRVTAKLTMCHEHRVHVTWPRWSCRLIREYRPRLMLVCQYFHVAKCIIFATETPVIFLWSPVVHIVAKGSLASATPSQSPQIRELPLPLLGNLNTWTFNWEYFTRKRDIQLKVHHAKEGHSIEST